MASCDLGLTPTILLVWASNNKFPARIFSTYKLLIDIEVQSISTTLDISKGDTEVANSKERGVVATGTRGEEEGGGAFVNDAKQPNVSARQGILFHFQGN